MILTVRATEREFPAGSVALTVILAFAGRRRERALLRARLARFDTLSLNVPDTPAASDFLARFSSSDLRPARRSTLPEDATAQASSHFARRTTLPLRSAR